MIDATFRPLPTWPHERTSPRRWHPFRASWRDTLELLDREVRHLRGRAVIIAAGFQEREIRLDGWPRGDAREPSHPGVEVSFDSRHGRLIYATDVCSHWQDNLRSIALGLEALRAVDRYGVSRRGEQYAGWKALPGGGIQIASTDEAWAMLKAVVGADPDDNNWELDELYRRAAKVAHPDAGGSDEAFLKVRAAYDLLKAAS